MENLNHLYTFYVTAQSGSCSAGAKTLHVTQPAVSNSLRVLEDILGTQLIDRGKKRFVVTQSGKLLFEACRSMFSEYETAKEKIRLLTHGLSGTVAVGTHVPLGNLWLAPQLAPMQRQFPDITMTMVLSNEPPTLLQDVVDHVTDLAIVHLSDRITVPAELAQDRIARVPFQFAASAQYWKSAPSLRSVKDLAHHTLIDASPDHPIYQTFIAEALHLRTAPRYGKVIYINSIDAMIQAAQGGMGLIYISDHLLRVNKGKTALIPSQAKSLESHSTVSIVYREDSLDIPRITAVHGVLEKSLRAFLKGHP